MYQCMSLPGLWEPMFDEEHMYPLQYRSMESLTRSRLTGCDWAKHKHYCRLHHFMTCLRPDQLKSDNLTSIAYLTAGGRLGNSMSTYAAMLAFRFCSFTNRYRVSQKEITLRITFQQRVTLRCTWSQNRGILL